MPVRRFAPARGSARPSPFALVARASTLAALFVPGLAHACLECRQRVMDAVFGDGFLATLGLVALPIPLVALAAIALARRR